MVKEKIMLVEDCVARRRESSKMDQVGKNCTVGEFNGISLPTTTRIVS